MFGSSQQETLDLGFVLFGTGQQSVSVILRELMLSDRFDHVSPSFTVRDITIELSGRDRPLVGLIQFTIIFINCHFNIP
ncbi:unnamed protein product [Schistosoma curassoni]|uniref:Secreted protein n=1 Tax=Schistosoma curassoni TaxID=6186 RepID=A0A183K1W4_9TREM|nr:unnamed protein product [Schistosoma curassoni]